ncbi:hypothetical protein BHE74_00051103 [Ensete ventricosum]|nr:hypothetical protein BHE74_00051103 [Ensete ventricosum]
MVLEPSGAHKGRQPPAGAAVARGHDRLWPAHRGGIRLQRGAREASQLQGARKGLPPATSPAASRGDDTSRRGGRPLAGRLPANKGSRRLRRDSGGGAEGERGVRASFGEKDDPAPMNSGNFEYCPCLHNFHNTLNNSKNFEDYPLI